MNSKFSTVALSLACCAGAAQAQSSVTLYGTLGLAVRSSSNLDVAGNTKTELTGTNLGAGIWGLRGVEKLDGGMQVRFKLESGVLLDTGVLRNNALFGREASVGLDGSFGKIDIGRLQVTGNAAEALVRSDPLRGGGQSETIWPGVWTGARYDNALRYRLEVGPVFAGAEVSLGEQAAGGDAGRISAGTLGYAAGPLMVISVLQTARDGTGLHSNAITVGATYTVGDATWHGAFLHARRDKGFVTGATPGSALFNSDFAYAGIKAPADQDTNVVLLGSTVNMGRWQLRSAVFYSDSPHATLFSATRGGNQRTLYGVLAYNLSARTAFLMSADYNRWSGGWGGFFGATAPSLALGKPDGHDSRRTMSVGLLHTF
ncbi:MAG: porin [Pseudomonadota bacterium]